jgi:hypothetical protein
VKLVKLNSARNRPVPPDALGSRCAWHLAGPEVIGKHHTYKSFSPKSTTCPWAAGKEEAEGRRAGEVARDCWLTARSEPPKKKSKSAFRRDRVACIHRCKNVTRSAVHESGATPSLTTSRHLLSTPQISFCRPVVRLPPNSAFFKAVFW